MLLSKKVLLKSNSKNMKRYVDFGYDVPCVGEYFEVDIKDLSEYSRAIIQVKCDYCGKVFSKTYNNYTTSKKKNVINKDCCKDCLQIKAHESVKEKFGVENISMQKDIQEKIKENNLKKYGVEHTSNLKIVKDKMKDTNIKRYGCEYPINNKEVMRKIKNTNIKRYGVEYPLQSKAIQEKTKNTLLEKYGVDNPTKSKTILEKAMFRKSENGTQISSRQQNKLCSDIGGKLNFKFERFYLDIAFVDEKICVEYNGGGHNLSVKLGHITQKEFDRNENFRRKQLFNNNWKLIEFVSPKNKLFETEKNKKIFNYCLEPFKDGCHYIIIDIDNNKITIHKKQYDIDNLALND